MDEETTANRNGTKFNRRVVSAIAAAAVATGGLFGVQAVAASDTYRHLKLASGDGYWRGGRHGHFHGGFANMSDAEINDRVERMVKHVSIEIDATDDQETKLIELATSAARELKPLREQMRASREKFRDLLMADRIDREALDALRAERLAEFDRISKSLVGTLADMAEVLTPAQRELLEERIREFPPMHRGWRRG